jgi:hypothetical protein
MHTFYLGVANLLPLKQLLFIFPLREYLVNLVPDELV